MPVSDDLLRLLARLSGLYPPLAFITARRAVIRGWSMYPALAPGERVLFDRLAYRLGPPRHGDVCLACHPARPRLRMVKRVAALPGDVVAVDGERCWVNGVPFSAEGGSASGGGEQPASGAAVPPEPRTLDHDEYLLLGDALDFSTDSRQFGPVSRRHIIARAWLVYWPPGKVRRVRRGVADSEGQA